MPASRDDQQAPAPSPPGRLPLEWVSEGGRSPTGRLRYRGPLAHQDQQLHLHLAFDGEEPPFLHLAMERDPDGSWTAEVPDTDGHVLLDCALSAGDDWDNNRGANHRLWLELDPVDAHVHVRTTGLEPMGFDSLRTALSSGGMTHGLVSWQDNDFVDRVTAGVAWLTRLVWASPGGPEPDEVRRRLGDGAVGLKLHPSYDDFPADTAALDPVLQVAAETAVPVTVHSAPGQSDPDRIRRLAERFPQVPFVLYHTFLGLEEGRRRAARHARDLPNLHLETSWCGSDAVLRLLDEVGASRVLFGSDAAVDGPEHFVRSPPNVELTETYNRSLLRLAQRLPRDTLRALLEDNTRQLFGLTGPRRLAAATEPAAPAHELFTRALAQAQRVVDRVTPDQLALSTPCAQWDVRGLLGHLVAVVEQAVRVAEGRPVPSGPRITRTVRSGREAALLRRTAHEAARAWTAADAGPGDVRGPWGLLPAPVVLSGYVLELVAHTHDLVVATGQHEPLDRELGEVALRVAERVVPADGRAGSAAFAAARPDPAGEDVHVRLAAYLGRRHQP